MAAVAGFAALYKPQLTTAAVLCLIASCLRCLELEFVAALLASPVSAVCAVCGLCVFPLGLAYRSYAGGSSSSFSSSLSSSLLKQSDAGSRDSSSSSKQQPVNGSARVKLSRPPFGADLSIMLQTSSSPAARSSSSSGSACGSRARRRRLPRVSVELTPLPRLSLDFSSSSSRALHTPFSSSSRRGSLDAPPDDMMMMLPGDAAALPGRGGWAPSMARIPSSGDLPRDSSSGSDGGEPRRLLESSGGSGSQQLQQQLPTFAAAEATASLGLSPLPSGLEALDDVVNDTHLLQVGAIFGEPSARGALAAREAGGPVGHPGSFYGSADSDEALQPWELLVSEGNGGVLYWGWRRPLRKGLYMYMTRSVFLGASPAELRAFMMDDAYRIVWDAAINVLRPLPPLAPAAAAEPASPSSSSARTSASGSSSSGGSGSNAAVEAMAAATAARMSAAGAAATSAAITPAAAAAAASEAGADHQGAVLPHESAFLQAMVHFPKPMTSRSYVYARRVWPRPADGGCYCLSRGCEPPLGVAPPPPLPGRAVAVEDYASGCVIRAPAAALLPPEAAAAGPAAEVALVYFEDAHVRPGFANLGIKKGLWPMVQRTEKALRVYQAGTAANTHLQQLQPSGGSVPAGAAASPLMGRRSLSMGGVPLQQQQSEQHAAAGSSSCALARSASLQEVSSSSSVPCFPLMAGCDLLDEDEGRQHDAADAGADAGAGSAPTAAPPASVTSAGAANTSGTPTSSTTSSSSSVLGTIKAAIDAAGSPRKPEQQQQQQQAPSGRWSWLSSLGSSVGSVLKQSGQLLAAASLVLWRAQAQASFTLPTFEWHLLSWAYHRLSASSTLLLGPGSAAQPALAAAAACGSHHHHGSQLARVASHPLADWAPSGLVGTLARRVAMALPSHPLPLDTLQHQLDMMPAFGCTCGGCCHGDATNCCGGGPGSCCSGGSLGSGSSSACCCCALCASGSCSSSVASGGSSARARPSSGGGSVVRDGGRRHRRVVTGLVHAAGVRIARKLQTVLQPQQHAIVTAGGPGLFDIDE